ncbi:Protein of unknown function [Amycolatopsis pretoriensis]|uniref:Uncharacterized protein n=1 Tax=Amycolatopsis pretoriensis TaxID=218821 RepID=A0A1H5Q364_9PSEU|nr:DUF1152 domain-containing protein [Amycolatopsis pretoriensis]SEF20550.1 Protein of unknown function [Amycolatopsis pretoriensis]
MRPHSSGDDAYFPERTLARWLDSRGRPSVVHAFPRTGVRPLRAAYRDLGAHLGVDAVVLVDGGTDILRRGDEAGLGTPEEDMTSLAAVAALDRGGGYLGALSIPSRSPEAEAYLDAVADASAPPRTGPASCTGRSPPRCRDSSGMPSSPHRRQRALREPAHTETAEEVAMVIEAHRDRVGRRPRRAIPH